MRRKIHLVSLILLAFLAAQSCKVFKGKAPDFIFLVTLDTTRADFVRYAEADNKLTPNLGRLAKQGVYFDNAYCLIPITLPSHASIMYSLPPHVLKIYNNSQPKDVAQPSLAEIMKSKGYYTAAVISLGVLKAEYGLGKGFDQYIENFRPFFWYRNAAEVSRDAEKLVEEVAGKHQKAFFWLHYSDPHEPYYPPYFQGNFTISFNDQQVFQSKSTEQPLVELTVKLPPGESQLNLHSEIPWEVTKSKRIDIGYFTYFNLAIKSDEKPQDLKVVLPKRWKEVKINDKFNYYSRQTDSSIRLINTGKQAIETKVRFLYRMMERPQSRKALYRKEIRFMDKEFGAFIDYLKKKNLYDRCVFVVMGDHGEGLGEYNRHYGHIHYLYKIYTRVPLLLFGRGINERGQRPEVVSNLNIAPTILDLAGIKKPAFMRGDTLLKPIPKKRLLLETYSPEAYFDEFSLIDFPYQVLFHPGRTENKIEYVNLEKDLLGLTNIEAEIKDSKFKGNLLAEILKISRILTATKGKIANVSERHQEILNSLGYL